MDTLGAIKTAATAGELAQIIKVSAEALERTLADVARYARGEGADPFSEAVEEDYEIISHGEASEGNLADEFQKLEVEVSETGEELGCDHYR